MEQPLHDVYADSEGYRDHIATVDEKGRRIWIYPKKPRGWFTFARTILNTVLLVMLFGGPFIQVDGEPLLLFNVLERRFILFGIHFAPQDFHLFVFAMLTMMVFIILFTAVYGRLFCGWICPQTIFMEGVFRKIEYLIEGDANAQRRLNNSPWTAEKIGKKSLKHAIFFAVALLISHTFWAYIIGVDQVIATVTSPISQNLGAFSGIVVFSFVFYFVFSYLREQVCTTICPYGRLQGVLLDHNSIVIHYDFIRGEPRGKIQKTKPLQSPISQIRKDITSATALAGAGEPSQSTMLQESGQRALGDCIDCRMCVQVCPTGIDIRNGTQLECINCTACIDACDEIMEKIHRPKGLIRYDSYQGIANNRRKLFTPRVIAYSAVLAALVGLNALLLSNRTDVETIVLRTPGMLFQKVDDQHLSNLYNYQVINKTKGRFPLQFKVVTNGAVLKPVGHIPDSKPTDKVEGAFFIEMQREKLKGRNTKIVIEVYSEGKLLDRTKTNFLGPGY